MSQAGKKKGGLLSRFRRKRNEGADYMNDGDSEDIDDLSMYSTDSQLVAGQQRGSVEHSDGHRESVRSRPRRIDPSRQREFSTQTYERSHLLKSTAPVGVFPPHMQVNTQRVMIIRNPLLKIGPQTVDFRYFLHPSTLLVRSRCLAPHASFSRRKTFSFFFFSVWEEWVLRETVFTSLCFLSNTFFCFFSLDAEF